MPRQYSPIELNTFVGGLITEASPLTFPANASLDEENFTLSNNGYRTRRLGMQFDSQTNIPVNTILEDTKFNSFKWGNVSNIAHKTIIVVQVGARVDFLDGNNEDLTSSAIHSEQYPAETYNLRYSFAAVDGKLVIVNGSKFIDTFEYDSVTDTISKTSKKLLIRDFFGVSDIDTPTGYDLKVGSYINYRPSTLTDAHLYNLRNQTWAIPRPTFDGIGGDDQPYDVINSFHSNRATAGYPSNSDSLIPSLYANTSAVGNKQILRFNAGNAVLNPTGTNYAPTGYFIIDALDRGNSRLQQIKLLNQQNPRNQLQVSNLPTDSSTAGPTVVCEYSGRAFYTGFSGDVVGGDAASPKLASYVFFSQLITDASSVTNCYQEGDPTSKDFADILDTDGGFIRIQGAYNIAGMVNIGSALIVFAENGVWSIQGGNSYGFTATNYKVTKITDSGCTASGSIVTVETSVYFWSRDGIYYLHANQYGDLVCDNITRKTIQTLYNSLDPVTISYVQGVYDSYEHRVKWLYNNRHFNFNVGNPLKTTELTLDVTLGAFYKYTLPLQTVAGDGSTLWPYVVMGVQTDPFILIPTEVDVIAGGYVGEVLVNTDQVVVESNSVGSGSRNVRYLCIFPNQYNSDTYAFSTYIDPNHLDFDQYLGMDGVDAAAFLLTGVLSGGDYQRDKGISYMTTHFTRTESDGVEHGAPLNDESSCFVQTQWDWSNSVDSGRWTRAFQYYRLRSPYYPGSDGATNFNVVKTRNKVRGSGEVLSFLFTTEPLKHCEILGWSLTVGVNGNV